MGIFADASNMLSQAFTTTTRSIRSVDTVLDSANSYIEEQSNVWKRTIKVDAIETVAKHHDDVVTRLNANAQLKKLYISLEAEWDQPTEIKSLFHGQKP